MVALNKRLEKDAAKNGGASQPHRWAATEKDDMHRHRYDLLKKRRKYNYICGTLGALFGVWSLWVAFNTSSTLGHYSHEQLGKFLVGFWVLIPPIFFWVDWVKFTQGLSKDQLDKVKHTHDLSRNIWLALVVVLASLFGITFS